MNFQQLTQELYRAFDFFNEKFGEDKLKQPIITIQTKGRRSAYGWYCSNLWMSGDDKVPEINISAEFINRGANDVLETLIHEMAHLWNAQHGIVDCTGNQYHNRKFKEAAEQFGLIVSKMPGKGWATTKLGDKAKQAIKQFKPDEELFKFKRLNIGGSGNTTNLKSIAVSDITKDRITTLALNKGMSQKDLVDLLLDEYMDNHE